METNMISSGFSYGTIAWHFWWIWLFAMVGVALIISATLKSRQGRFPSFQKSG
jgi:hypothetical protein